MKLPWWLRWWSWPWRRPQPPSVNGIAARRMRVEEESKLRRAEDEAPIVDRLAGKPLTPDEFARAIEETFAGYRHRGRHA